MIGGRGGRFTFTPWTPPIGGSGGSSGAAWMPDGGVGVGEAGIWLLVAGCWLELDPAGVKLPWGFESSCCRNSNWRVGSGVGLAVKPSALEMVLSGLSPLRCERRTIVLKAPTTPAINRIRRIVLRCSMAVNNSLAHNSMM